MLYHVELRYLLQSLPMKWSIIFPLHFVQVVLFLIYTSSGSGQQSMSCHSLFFLRKTMNLVLYTCSGRSIRKMLRNSLHTTKFPLGLETISQTSFPMINYYSLIITSFIAGKVSINDVTQLCYTTRVCLRPLTLVWKSCHYFLDLELSLVPMVVFILQGGSTTL